jgi:TolB-like protein
MRAFTIICTLLLVGTWSFADQPTTAPAPPVALVAPFQQLGDPTNHTWVGQALQEDILATISRSGLQAKPVDKPLPGSDGQAVAKVARDMGAGLAVSGTYQIVEDQIRINGQVTDVASGRAVGSLQATGNVRDLFNIEDSLSAQLQPLLPQMQTTATAQAQQQQLPTVTYGPQGAPTYTYANTQPQTYSVPTQPDNSPTTTYYYPAAPDYSYTYSPPVYYYPYTYTYSYPYFWGGIVINNGRFFRGGFHDGFHGGFRGGFGGHGDMGGHRR